MPIFSDAVNLRILPANADRPLLQTPFHPFWQSIVSVARLLVASNLRGQLKSLPHDLTLSTPSSVVKNQKQSLTGRIGTIFPEKRAFPKRRLESQVCMVAIVTLLSESGRGERLCLSFPSQASFFFKSELARPSRGQLASLKLLDRLESLVPAAGSAKDRDQ